MIEFSKKRADTFEHCPWFTDDVFATWIIGHLSKLGNSIADIGAGTGYMLDYYRNTFDASIGIEPSQNMLYILNDRFQSDNSVRIFQGDASKIPLADKSIDVSISKSSLHHFEDYNEGIAEMKRVSKKAIAVIEVILPHINCSDFLKNILLKKEVGRSATSVFSEEDITSIVTPHVKNLRNLHFDQYIIVERWLKNSDLDKTTQNEIIEFILNQEPEINNLMQIHRFNNETYMLRRMNLCIGLLK